jgi:hypothetical protein
MCAGSAIRTVCVIPPAVGGNNVCNQTVPNNVSGLQDGKIDVIDPREDFPNYA